MTDLDSLFDSFKEEESTDKDEIHGFLEKKTKSA